MPALYLSAPILFLTLVAIWVALPGISDLLSLLKVAVRRPKGAPAATDARPRLLLLVPAHNEAHLIRRCIESLRVQGQASERVSIVVLADNCTDETADRATQAGATVLTRIDPLHRGKGYAIGWALPQLDCASYDAAVILDADTTVNADFYDRVAELVPLRQKAVQCYDGLSNETENWLTLLAGMVTRNRYDLALPLKQAAGLRIPLTGDGTLLGTDILRRHGWRSDSLTEGWDLYARLTLAGERIELARAARIYAQEARSLKQAGSQRARWSAGRASVLRENWRMILASRSISMHQKLDLVAELSSPGPVLNIAFALGGVLVAAAFTKGLGRLLLLATFAVPLLHQASFTLISLTRHPQPWSVIAAGLRLPYYAVWRVALAAKLVLTGRPKEWTRTARHHERAKP